MASVADIASGLREMMCVAPVALERETGFVQRRSKLNGSAFVQTLVFGWLSNPAASLDELTQTAAAVGVRISPQGLDARFTPSASNFLRQILETAVLRLFSSDPAAVPVLQRFNGVYVLDSSTISLPAPLKDAWPGCGGSNPAKTASALKIQVRLELVTGTLTGPFLQSARTNDNQACMQRDTLPVGSLRIADTGYFSLSVLAQMSRDGVYWLTRIPAHVSVWDSSGCKRHLAEVLQELPDDSGVVAVELGASKVPCWLLAVRVPHPVAQERRRRARKDAKQHGRTPSKERLEICDWTILATNVPPERCSLRELLVLARARWQIELLFKLWKSHGRIDEWRSQKPFRILCEVYAKLMAMLLQHWLFLLSAWSNPFRSLVKAAKTVQRYALFMASTLTSKNRLNNALTHIAETMQSGCQIEKSRSQPSTAQLLTQCSPLT